MQKPKISVTPEYTCASTNRFQWAMDWGKRNGIVCFGVCNAVALYRPNVLAEDIISSPNHESAYKLGIFRTLVGHKKIVKCVRWIRRHYDINMDIETELVSGGDDNNARVWTLDSNWNCKNVAILEGDSDSGPITVIDAMYMDLLGFMGALVVTISGGFRITLWKRQTSSSSFHRIQVINCRFPVYTAAGLSFLPGSKIPLLVFTDMGNLHLYTSNDELEVEGNYATFNLKEKIVAHTDVIRSIDFSKNDDSLFLATGSQDRHVRVWKIRRQLPSDIEMDELKTEEHVIDVDGKKFLVVLETILKGHSEWVEGVHWHPSIGDTDDNETGSCQDKVFSSKLLSVSMDKTIIIWHPDPVSGIWIEETRIGITGGTDLGFFAGKFSGDGKYICALGFNGDLNLWRLMDDKTWSVIPTSSGHSAAVTDIQWEVKGQYLLSVSKDQTTRLHAPCHTWMKKTSRLEWMELVRPQMHGYDINCLATLHEHRFASGADEKLIRVFVAPRNFFRYFKKFSDLEEVDETQFPYLSATLGPLQLSNQPTCAEEGEHDVESNATSNEVLDKVAKSHLPEEFRDLSLWPELKKLYAHGSEIYSLAASPDGLILASACKSVDIDFAVIILWDMKTLKVVQKLYCHRLTVSQMSFSPDNTRLLSVSKDRRWFLCEKKFVDNEYKFEVVAKSEAKNGLHGRIIWSCAWSCDSTVFATASRDGKLAIWGKNDNIEKWDNDKGIIEQKPMGNTSCLGEYKNYTFIAMDKESFTSVAFSPRLLPNMTHLLALGFESGVIRLYSYIPDTRTLDLLTEISTTNAHHFAVKRLVFRPDRSDNHSMQSSFHLASCGEDYLVRIHNIKIESDI